MRIVFDKIGESLSKYISEKIDVSKIPDCFGNMGQPVLYKSEDILSDCISPINMIAKSKQKITLDKVLDKEVPNLDASKYCITEEGAGYIEGVKENIATAYANKLLKCSSCKVFDRCDRVTSHTLKKVELEVLLNK